MKTSHKILLTLLACLTLAGLDAFVAGKRVDAAAAAPVTVVNTPLPVAGAVSASQSGSWTVGISGTPTVAIGNSSSTPVPTKDVLGIGAASPVSFTDSFNIGTNIFGGESTFYVVPAAKRLIVKYVSASCDLPGSGNAHASLASDQGHPNATAFMGMTFPMRSVPYPALGTGFVRSTGGTPAEVLFDPGETVQVVISRTNGDGDGFCFVTGYLINPL